MSSNFHNDCTHKELCTKEEVTKWFDIGLKARCRNLIIVLYRGDNHCRPLYVTAMNDPHYLQAQYEKHHGCKIYEVYSLFKDRDEQLNNPERCFNYEPR